MDDRKDYWYDVINLAGSTGWIHGRYLQRGGPLPSYVKDLVWGYGDVRNQAIENLKASDETTKKGVSLYLMAVLIKRWDGLYNEQRVRTAEALNIAGYVPQRLVKDLMDSLCTAYLTSDDRHSDAQFPEAEVIVKLGSAAHPVVINFLLSQNHRQRYCGFQAVQYTGSERSVYVHALSELIEKLIKESVHLGKHEIANELNIIAGILGDMGAEARDAIPALRLAESTAESTGVQMAMRIALTKIGAPGTDTKPEMPQ